MSICSIRKGAAVVAVLTAIALFAPSGVLASGMKDKTNTEAVQDLGAKVGEALREFKNVKFSVAGDDVVLRGHVDSQKEKDLLESRIRAVEGVKYVRDAVMIRQEESNAVGEFFDDTAITTEIKARILAREGLDSLDIGVRTDGGVVTLSGRVDNGAQVELAEKVAREVKGVKKIINTLFVHR